MKPKRIRLVSLMAAGLMTGALLLSSCTSAQTPETAEPAETTSAATTTEPVTTTVTEAAGIFGDSVTGYGPDENRRGGTQNESRRVFEVKKYQCAAY